MNHILGFAQLLTLKKELTEKQEASVRQILESGRRLLDADRSYPWGCKVQCK